jgi:ribonuclease HI
MDIVVFTDGSHRKIKKKAVKYTVKKELCGYGVYFPNGELPNIGKPFVYKPLTNQRAELYAIYKALKLITKKLKFNKITIYSDSEYSIKCFTEWVFGWEKNNWKTSKGQDVKNRKIIERTHEMLNKIRNKVTFKHVFSHTGGTDFMSLGNAEADKLANQGALLSE